MTVIGITGPTGAGKTTALDVLRELGGYILDADAVYHELLESDIALRSALEKRFGPLTAPDGTFDRKKLGAVVFRDPAALADLNAIAHKRVVDEMERRLHQAEAEGKTLAAVDAIALFESGAAELCQTTVAVTAPPEARVRRIMAREGIPEDYARARVAAQHTDDFYAARCQHLLVNDCSTRAEFAQKARELFREILEK